MGNWEELNQIENMLYTLKGSEDKEIEKYKEILLERKKQLLKKVKEDENEYIVYELFFKK